MAGAQWQNCGVDGNVIITDGLGNVLAELDSPDFGFEAVLDFCIMELDLDNDGFLISEGDCNDYNPDINPNAEEICDGLDNNCNGEIDENFETNTYYLDSDSDNYGNSEITITSCFQPDGYSTNGNDCDDENPNVNPGNDEECDGIDNNCNDEIDEGFTPLLWFLDGDNDGYGNPNFTTMSCFQPDNYVNTGGDCNDLNNNVYPGAVELCNQSDDNCNELIDDGLTTQIYFEDADNDDYGNPDVSIEDCEQPNGYVENDLDCDDSDENINPSADEILDDGIDQDCDGFDLTTGITEQAVGNFLIYPNPATGSVLIKMPDANFNLLEMFDSSGRLVASHLLSKQTEIELNTALFSRGIYTYRAHSNGVLINGILILE